MEISQYKVVLVNLNPSIGSEIRKTSPCVIISPDEMNKHIRTVVVAPMTSISRKYPTRIPAMINKTSGWIAIDQIHTIDKKRIIKTIGKLTEAEISTVKIVLKETFVD